MRVGIITFHCSCNFGSMLQTYALYHAVAELGVDTKIIDYRSHDYNQYKLFRIRKPMNMLHDAMQYSSRKLRKETFASFLEQNLLLTQDRFSYRDEVALEQLQQEFDAFICGSDQIWNLDCTKGVVEPFFLSFAGDRRRIAYAPSLAHTSFKPEYFDREKISELLSRFDYLSVREEETVPLFQPLVDKKIEVVLDPTLLLDADAYADMAQRCIQEESYLFVYLLRKSPELIESAAKLAEKTGKTVAYVSERKLPIPNSVNYFGVGPEEFLSLIAHADAVLTNSFHATVFSVLFHRPFRVFATDQSASRMRDLMMKLDVPERCVAAVDASPVADEDWASVDCRLDALRADSWAYLRKALS